MRMSDRRRRLRILGDLLANRWKQAASGLLKSTLRVYKQNVMVDDVKHNRVRVVLLGVLPNIVEQGMGPSGVGSYGPYDVRKFVLPWKNPRTGKIQDHVAIPFRRSKGDIAGFGGASAVAAAQRLKPTVMRGDGTMSYGGRLPDPSGFAQKIRASPDIVGLDVGRPTIRPAHATDPLAGMIKQVAGYGGRMQAKYVVFRMMSLRGKPWISPGVKPRKIAEKVDVGAAISDAFRVAL